MFPSKPFYATSTCKPHLSHTLHRTYLQVAIWRWCKYTHSPWMQKFLYSISQGVPFFLFFPLFFLLLGLPAFFSFPLFTGLGLTTGSTEKDKVAQSSIAEKLDAVKMLLQHLGIIAGEPLSRKQGKQVNKSRLRHIQNRDNGLQGSWSSTLSPHPEQCRQSNVRRWAGKATRDRVKLYRFKQGPALDIMRLHWAKPSPHFISTQTQG